jgi:hypothetical protein
MTTQQSRFGHSMFWPTLLVLGLFAEVAIWLIASFWATRYGVDGWSLRGVIFAISVCCLYLGSQVLAAAFGIETVAGLSLTLLSAMLAWAGAIAALLGLVFLVCLTAYSVVAIPGRILYFTVARHRSGKA